MNRTIGRDFVAFTVVLLAPLAALQAVEPVNMAQRTSKLKQEEARREARLQWFHEAKYGFFINWGLYSIPAGEWKSKPIRGIGEWIMHNARIPVKEYEQLAKQFNPVKFNADEWRNSLSMPA